MLHSDGVVRRATVRVSSRSTSAPLGCSGFSKELPSVSRTSPYTSASTAAMVPVRSEWRATLPPHDHTTSRCSAPFLEPGRATLTASPAMVTVAPTSYESKAGCAV